MPRVRPPILGTLLTAASVLTGCGTEPLHADNPTPPVALAPEAVAPALTGVTPPPAASPPAASAVPAASASAAPPRDDLAVVPEGACVRKPPGHGVPRLSAPDPGGSRLPLIEDLLARQARGPVDACLARAARLSGRLVMRIELPAAGGISKAAVEAGAGDGALHRCVSDALEAAAMPSFGSGGSLVLRPFVLGLCPDGTAAWPTSWGWH
jgi:hypothetical protein